MALGLHEVPELNSVWKDEKLNLCTEINVGVAISLRQGGLVAPALLGTDKQNLAELMKNFRDLVKRARAGSLRSSELSESTITFTSLGERGAESVFGIIYPPQVAIIGFGRPTEWPRTLDGQIVLRPAIKATLSGDQLDIDSMYFLNFVIALDEELDVRILESDYPKLSTLDACVGLLSSWTTAGETC